MSHDEYKVPVSVRIPISILKELDKLVEQKKYADRSDAVRTLMQDGTYLNKIILMVKNPKKVNEIVKKLKNIDTMKDVEHTLDTMEPHELLIVQKLALNIRDKKVQQTVLDMAE